MFVWGGAGQAYVSETTITRSPGMPAGRSTTRPVASTASLKTDLHRSNAFSHRIDTLQLGIAPYEHDIDTLATWFVVQGRHYTGGIHDGTEWAFLLRLFKGGAWIEAGVTDRRQTPGHGHGQFLNWSKLMKKTIFCNLALLASALPMRPRSK